ncbi:hypothetical protein FIV02_11725 [Pseudomonas sp. THAF187a]|uniref:DUF1329 domain-containing protein n=1 Tax=unclassified Pseudomonas TaxID=196821 RepID=UPI001269175C|nr:MULTISPECIES: DUF1329 domain-containing protein [unclassified Pseudomonas]QFT22239.1 hypothetical protein FIV02_11725 [Pseudomonas sp. THAF187a]QFT42426.1 hypothetical protein FIU98_11705 [Pseudomonas sp. THAF42]
MNTPSMINAALTATLLCSCLSVQAKVSEAEAARLGQDLTPTGAEKAGNADGSIPAWTGKWLGVPPHVKFAGPGTPYPDPYAGEKPLFVITSANMARYAEHLSDGQKALFQRYPQSFRMPIYPSHRDFRTDSLLEKLIKTNALNAEVADNGNETVNAWGASPFPIPQSGVELLFNHTMRGGASTEEANYLQVVRYSDGNRVTDKLTYKIQSIWSDPNYSLENANGAFVNFFTESLAPVRKKGEIIVGHEFIDSYSQQRQAWQYTPGQRRVRRAPTVGYDTPNGAGGFRTFDEDRLFNGSPDRYEWKIVGKRELFIPYHNYRIDAPEVTIDQILSVNGHVDPDLMRYEKHRVWVLEGTLKAGARHIYAKRVMYLDEDSWAAIMADNYDGRGLLWRTNMQATIYAYDIQRLHARLGIYHDLIAGSYLVDRLLDEQKPALLNVSQFPAEEFTPSYLRKLGTR